MFITSGKLFRGRVYSNANAMRVTVKLHRCHGKQSTVFCIYTIICQYCYMDMDNSTYDKENLSLRSATQLCANWLILTLAVYKIVLV